MSSGSSSQAAGLYAQILGQDNVITNTARLREAQTATFKTTQQILGILKPHSVADIQKVVKIAGKYKTPLYAISTGKNWGYGSRTPIHDGSFLLDLSSMNAIVGYNDDLGYVTVEPGVTQRQLHAFLKKKQARFSLGMTGSAPDTSIVGNVCERGVGLGPYSFRAHYVGALEVVLPSGKLIHTGYGRFSNAQAAPVYPEGLGPSFTNAFIQSNLGIITKLTLLLAPRPKYTQFIDLYISEKNLQESLKTLHTFKLFSSSQKTASLYNDLQMLASRTQYPWAAAGGKTPLPAKTAAALKEKYGITYAWRGIVEIYGYTRQEVTAQVNYFKSLAKDMDGIELSPLYRTEVLDDRPNDLGRGSYWRMKTKPPKVKNPDTDGCGQIRLSLAVPFAARSINEVTETIKRTVTRYGYEPFVEIHCISARWVLVVATLIFDRTETNEDTNALRCHDALLRAVMRQGYYPYRLNVRAASLIPGSVDDYDDFQHTIKQALDPNAVFSPGRYEVRG